ncbi:hypothetical protein MMC15_007991 [Xylographa vitiligo]|nr:hypothetical protein [Xylographa vitiligo]
MTSHLPNHATLTFTHHPTPLSLSPRSPHPPTTLPSLCQASTPPCALHPILFNGHLQTIWTAFTATDPPIHYKRHVFPAHDPAFAGRFAVDFVVPPSPAPADATLPPRTTFYTAREYEELGGADDSAPMVVVLHGLSGGSHEAYLRAVLQPLVAAGWAACVVNARGCARSALATGVLYNARATWDVRQVVGWCRGRWPRRELFGVGFSLGANILVNYLGEEGERCVLKAAVVCSNPWNLEVGSLALQRTWVGREVYSRAMGTSMRKLFETHEEQIAKNPRVDVEKVRGIRYLHEFDRELQCPTWGYPTEGAYYRDASSSDSLLAVRIPLFAINAEDDPIAVKEGLPYEEFKQTPYAVLCTTSLGGHLSWFESGGNRWFAKPISQFLIKMATEVDRIEPPEHPTWNSAESVDKDKYAPSFIPMRRRLRLHFDP